MYSIKELKIKNHLSSIKKGYMHAFFKGGGLPVSS
jgi:hypothetical protein